MDRRRATGLGPQRLARLLGGWTTTRGTLPERLARALRELMNLGELIPGSRLPSERALAAALVVSRATVVTGYELLHSEGLLDSRPGSGHWIARRQGASKGGLGSAAAFPWLHRLASTDSPLHYPETVVDLSAITTAASPVLDDVLGSLGAEDWASVTEESAYLPLGWPPLRLAIADECCRRGLPTVPEQVLVTSGAQQGLSLVVGTLVRAGDVVATEEPAYPGAFPVLREAGARLRTAPVGADGVDVDALVEILRSENPRLALVAPMHHNPTGSVLRADARAHLAAIAGRRGLVIVELYAAADLSLDDLPAPAPLASIGDPESMVVIGSLSAVVWSGLRIGWLRVPSHLVSRLAEKKALADLGTPLLPQLVATRLLAELPLVRRLRNADLAARCRLAIDALASQLPEFEVRRPAGGGCLWLQMPAGLAGDFVQVGLRHGVAVLPGPLCSANGGQTDRLRLAFTGNPTALIIGVERLADAWKDYRSHAR